MRAIPVPARRHCRRQPGSKLGVARAEEKRPRTQNPEAPSNAVSMFRLYAIVKNYVVAGGFAQVGGSGFGNRRKSGESESPKRAADVTAGAVPAASPQTSAHASDFRAFDEMIDYGVVLKSLRRAMSFEVEWS